MAKRSIITMSQLFILLFVSRIIMNLAYTPLLSKSNSMCDLILSAIIAFLFTFLFIIPIYKLYDCSGNLNIVQYSFNLVGKVGIIFSLVYAIYFLFTCAYSLSLFNIFVGNIISPEISLMVLSLAIVLASCYGAFKGIEAIARSAGVIFILICIAIIFIVIALVPKIDNINYEPIMYNGPCEMINGTVLMISQTACIPALAMLLPSAKGDVKKGFVWWNLFVYLSVLIMIIVIVGALGDYLKTQMFPVYSAINISEIGILKHLDSLYLGIWTSGLFIKISLFLYIFALCIKKVWGEKVSRWSILIGGFLVAVLSVLASGYRMISNILFDLKFSFGFTVLVSVILPTVLLIVDKVKNGQGVNNNEM